MSLYSKSLTNSDSQKISLYDFFFLSCLTTAFFFLNLGKGSLASWDEGVYALVAREILKSGDWLRFTIDGSPWADKPPLCIWAMTLSYKLFGLNEFSTRLFSCLMGIGSVLVTYLFGAKLFGRWAGFLGALVLMSSSHFIHFSKFGMMDAPVTFFISLALYFFWLGREKNRYLIFSGIVIGIAFITKSFVALFVFPVTWIYCFWAGELKVLARSSYWIGVILAVLIALPWNLYEMLIYHDFYFKEAVEKHLFLRTTKVLDGHQGSLYFYIRTMVNKYHPWALISIASAPAFLFESFRTRRKEFIFTAVWIFSIFVIVSFMQTKLDWYILPLYPALSLTVGYYLGKLLKEKQSKFVQAAFIVIMLLHVQYSHIFNHDYSHGLKGIAPASKPVIAPAEFVYLYNFHDAPAAGFYLEKKISYLDDPEAFLRQAKAENPFYCFVYEKDLASLNNALSAQHLAIKASFEDLRLVVKEKHS